MIVWRLLGMIGAPILAVALGYVWVTDAWTIRNLRGDVAALTGINTKLAARRDRLEAAIEGQAGWRVRLSTAEKGVKDLRSAVIVQNKMIDGLIRAAVERQSAADAKLAEVRADRDQIEARYTVILNMSPQSDIARQALEIVLGEVP